MKRENGFYWVKWEKNRDWEVARWDDGVWRFTDGSKSLYEPIKMIIDERIIVRNED